MQRATYRGLRRGRAARRRGGTARGGSGSRRRRPRGAAAPARRGSAAGGAPTTAPEVSTPRHRSGASSPGRRAAVVVGPGPARRPSARSAGSARGPGSFSPFRATRVRGGCPPSRSSSRGRRPAGIGSPPGSSGREDLVDPAVAVPVRDHLLRARLRLAAAPARRKRVSATSPRTQRRGGGVGSRRLARGIGGRVGAESSRPPWVDDQGRVNDV